LQTNYVTPILNRAIYLAKHRIIWNIRVIRWNSTPKDLPLQSSKKFLKKMRHIYYTCLQQNMHYRGSAFTKRSL